MFAYIKGILEECRPTQCVIDVSGVGYEIKINTQVFGKIKGEKSIKLFTHYHKSDHGDTLFGFYSKPEKELFLKLISVNKIGPSTAQVMLSTFLPEELIASIVNGNVGKLVSIKGIGSKTAQRIIVELRDKLETMVGMEDQTGQSIGVLSERKEAEQALLSLGFTKAQVQKVHKQIENGDNLDISLEDYLKEALFLLSK